MFKVHILQLPLEFLKHFPSLQQAGLLISVLRRSWSKFCSLPLFLFQLKLTFEARREAEQAKREARGVSDHDNHHITNTNHQS